MFVMNEIIIILIILLIDLKTTFAFLNNKIRTILILILTIIVLIILKIITKVFRNREIMTSNIIIHFSIINRD